jgi:hypothetical protein
MSNKKEKIGEINFNKNNKKMEIIEYQNYDNITVKFENDYITCSTYSNFKNGCIKNPYDKTVYGIGFIGEGKYKANNNHKQTRIYTTWTHMLRRCYNEKCQEKQPSYINCEVCEEWHNFQNFGKWYDENYYEVDRGRMHLDKDILNKYNKIYSPENCVFVPHTINCLFVNRKVDRGEYPLGVCWYKKTNKFCTTCNDINKSKYLGSFNTVDEAFNTYKIYKEKLIKQIAEEYKNKIPQKLYNAMYRYKIEITD